MDNFGTRDGHQPLSPHVLNSLLKTNPLIHAAEMVLNWLIILATICACIIFLNPLTYFVAILIIGARMHALAILMHDATHFRFLKNRKWNDLITNITTMYPLFLTIENYRGNHLRHHQHVNTEHDPDWVAKLHKKEFLFPQSKWAFIKTVLSYFLLWQGIKDAYWFVKRFNIVGGDKKKSKRKGSPIPQLLFYGTLITSLSIFGGWWYFLIFWVVPYFSTFLMFQYIRSIAEHFGDLKREHNLNGARTVKTNALERFFIAPHNIGYHIEHHLYPGVPFYHLPKLHELLMQTDEFKQEAHITEGYLSGLIKEL